MPGFEPTKDRDGHRDDNKQEFEFDFFHRIFKLKYNGNYEGKLESHFQVGRDKGYMFIYRTKGRVFFDRGVPENKL